MGGEGVGREIAQGVQPATASQRLGLSAAGAGGQIPQVPGTGSYPLGWTSHGPGSNLRSGLVPGGQGEHLNGRAKVKENEDRIFKNGSFTVSPGHQLSGTLSLNGPDSILHLWCDGAMNIDLSKRETITGVLNDQKKVSLLGCVPIRAIRSHRAEGVSHHYKFFPHYVIIGNRYFPNEDKAISEISLVVDDAATLFHDRESFGTLIKDPDELNKIIVSEKFDSTPVIGERPVIAYYTGKNEIFSANTVIGKVSARNSPSFNSGGPEGVYIKNRIFVDIEFNEPVNVREMDSRMRRVLSFFEVIVGRPQNLLETNIVQRNKELPQASAAYINMYPILQVRGKS